MGRKGTLCWWEGGSQSALPKTPRVAPLSPSLICNWIRGFSPWKGWKQEPMSSLWEIGQPFHLTRRVYGITNRNFKLLTLKNAHFFWNGKQTLSRQMTTRGAPFPANDARRQCHRPIIEQNLTPRDKKSRGLNAMLAPSSPKNFIQLQKEDKQVTAL